MQLIKSLEKKETDLRAVLYAKSAPPPLTSSTGVMSKVPVTPGELGGEEGEIFSEDELSQSSSARSSSTKGSKRKKKSKSVGMPKRRKKWVPYNPGVEFPENFVAPWRKVGSHSYKPDKGFVPTEKAFTTGFMALDISAPTDFHLAYLELYLAANGERVLWPVPGDGSCQWSAIRRQLQCPSQYTNMILRREVAFFLLTHWEILFPMLKKEIRHYYGYKDTEVGPFSYLDYVEHILTPGTWGDQITLKLISLMWGVKVTVILMDTCSEIRIRHDQPLADADLVLILQGQHYSAAVRYNRVSGKKGEEQHFGVQALPLKDAAEYKASEDSFDDSDRDLKYCPPVQKGLEEVPDEDQAAPGQGLLSPGNFQVPPGFVLVPKAEWEQMKAVYLEQGKKLKFLPKTSEDPDVQIIAEEKPKPSSPIIPLQQKKKPSADEKKARISEMERDVHKAIPEGQVKCKICEKEFLTTANLRKHAAVHRGVDLYRCGMCGREFQYKFQLANHRATHDAPQFACSKNGCSKTFFHKKTLTKHEKSCGSLGGGNCPFCQEYLHSFDSLRSHKSTCVKNTAYKGPFQCKYCGHQPYKYKRDLIAHMKKKHGLKK